MLRTDALAALQDQALTATAAALDEAGHWAEVVDAEWRLVHMTEDFRRSMGAIVGLAPAPLGAHYFGPEACETRLSWPLGPNSVELLRPVFASLGRWTLADTPGGRDELRRLVDPRVRDLVDELQPSDGSPVITYTAHGTGGGGTTVPVSCTALRIHDAAGRRAGAAIIFKPAAGMSVLATIAAGGDLRHFARMQSVARAARRPAAVLFADLDGSSPLARRLSTRSYFALGRRLVRAADACIIEAGGIVGRHVGDGMAAFFLAETAGSESAAARGCVEAARMRRAAVEDVAVRTGLAPEDVQLRFGLHWGAMLYVGQILTSGRAEVTALGDEVNEAARIEACAAGGRTLASKALIERLDGDDAAAVGIDPDGVSYTTIGQLEGASDKALRDAAAISVCAI